MPSRHCPDKPCCDPNDDPSTNVSSEDLDPQSFVGVAWGSNLVLPDNDCQSYPCFDSDVSTVSQDDADFTAQRKVLQCEYPHGPLFGNTPQSASLPCPDGSQCIFPVAEGTFLAATQLLADRLAFTYASKQVKRLRICVGEFSLTECCSGSQFSAILDATARNQDVTFAVTLGSLPPGLSLDQTGPKRLSIIGSSTSIGPHTFTIRTSGTSGGFVEKEFTINIAAISTTTLLDSKDTFFYSQPLHSTGFGGLVLWSMIGGTLPPGLSLNTNTGVISGLCSGSGTFHFTVSATDGIAQCQKSLTIVSEPSNLTLWWAFEEPSGLTANDSSGNANNGGISTDVPYPLRVTGKKGNLALEFIRTKAANVIINATAGQLHNMPNGTSPFTIACWYRLTDTSTGDNNDRYIVAYGDNTNPTQNKSFGIHYHRTEQRIGIKGNDGFVRYGLIVDTNWHHVAAVWPGGAGDISTAQFYVDAVLKTSVATSPGTVNIPTGLTVLTQCFVVAANRPAAPSQTNFSPDAQIDDVKFFNIALSADQVTGLFNA